MSLNSVPTANRVHIGIFGKRNAGKSSIINAITNQNIAIVSEVLGTTTDPVYKSMEILPLGPVVVIDTPGLDDIGELGEMRVKKAKEVLNKTDIALIIADAKAGLTEYEKELENKIKDKKIPYLIVFNKADLIEDTEESSASNSIFVSAVTKKGINELKEKIASLVKPEEVEKRILGDLIAPKDFIILVVPIDSAAPKGRLILPQQQTIRDILDSNAVSIVCQPSELKETIAELGKKPKLVICDSQAFSEVEKDTPKDILLTSFSILFARYKGNLKALIEDVKTIDSLEDGDTVLISEGCTHHRQCDDIGTVKIPRWLKEHTKKNIIIETSSGAGFPEELEKYKLIIHCGGCMLNEKEMQHRIKTAKGKNIPIVNYGILIAYLKGILKRSVECFSDIEL